MKQVSEDYSNERRVGNNLGDFNERFQQLTREVLNEVLVDINIIGDKVFQKEDNTYVSYVALEARKKTVFKKLKEIASLTTSLNDKDKQIIKEMIDKSIKDLDDGE